MVVSALVQLAIAGPVGILFGLGYGTAIRVGYEQVYPALFGDKALPKDTDTILKKLETFYTTVGGLEAHKFGINQGIKNALKAIDADPELVELIKKNSSLDSQSITVNLSGISQQTQNLGPSGKSSVFSPPSQSSGILFYVQALAKAEADRDVNEYARLVDIIGLNDNNLMILVRTGRVIVTTGGYDVTVVWGLLSLTRQREYVKRFNILNTAQRKAAQPQGPQTAGGGLLADTVAIRGRGRTGQRAAGQSQKLEKTKLINEIRDLKKTDDRLRGSGNIGGKIRRNLKFARQQLANLLARYRF